MPDIVCPMPRSLTHTEARTEFSNVRKEMPSLTDAAWRREAARRMNVDYDTFLKAWKKPKKTTDVDTDVAPPVNTTPVKPKIEDVINPRPVRPAPAPTPVTVTPVEVTYDSARATYKLVKREFPDWTDGQVRKEAARRMGLDYKVYLDHWKKPKSAQGAQRSVVSQPPNPTNWHVRVRRDDDPLIEAGASARSANPGFPTRRFEYTNNCTSCTTSFELRMRGYDVVARPLGPQSGENVYRSWGITWENQITTRPEYTKFYTQTYGTYKPSSINIGDVPSATRDLPDGARGSVIVVWKRRGAGSHIFNWIKVNGRLRYYDGQTGRDLGYGADHFTRAHDEVFMARLDNLPAARDKLDWLTMNRSDFINPRPSVHIPR